MTLIPRVKTINKQASASSSGAPLVALVGNPNTGKTSVFNMLTGARHRVANYPGITVEKVMGFLEGTSSPIEMVDLPGTYSLAARSPDEMIVIDTLLGRQKGTNCLDAVVVVVDASNLDRNLFLAAQVLETGVPTILALNMMDIAERNQINIDVDGISKRLGIPVVPIEARTRKGKAALVEAIEATIGTEPPSPVCQWPDVIEETLAQYTEVVRSCSCGANLPEYEIRRCLLDDGGYAEQRLLSCCGSHVKDGLIAARKRLADSGLTLPGLEASIVYRWVEETVSTCTNWENADNQRVSDKVDNIITHRVLGSIIFVVVMGAIFVSVFSWASPLMDVMDGAFGWAADYVRNNMAEGSLRSFLADGLVSGVGGVLIFLPQILVLFALITILEDCGYLARVAFLVDRVFRLFGLGGRSFIPLLSSFACAIPGVMAARTIENPKDRLITILIAPLMSCSARIPLYTIMVAAFVPSKMVFGFIPLQGLVFASMYMVGIIVAGFAAMIFKRAILRDADSTFLLELPTYKVPSIRSVLFRLYDRGKAFVLTAGTIILAMSIIVWALSYYPRPAGLADTVRADMVAKGETDEAAIHVAIDGAYLRQSMLGRMGKAIEPVVKPLGWDWRLGMATLASFPAREVVISTLGIVYNLGPEQDEESAALRDKLRAASRPDGTKVYTLPVALSVMVFFALCCQCQATIAVIKRETNSWKWPIFTFTYMTVLAYVAALLVYQVGSRIV